VFAGVTTDGGRDMTPNNARVVLWENAVRKDGGFTHTDNTSDILLDEAGTYLVFVNLPYFSLGQRESARLRILLDGRGVPGGQASQGYIRGQSGHNDASVHWSGLVIATNAGQALSIATQRETTRGADATIANGRMSIYVERLDVTSDMLYSRGNRLTPNSDNWNPDPPGLSVQWETDLVIDTNIYTHSTGARPERIVINEPGDYLLVYNDALAAPFGRPNPRVFIDVNGVRVPGAESKTHYLRGSDNHTESSASLVFLLHDLAAGDEVTVRISRDFVSGDVDDNNDAQLFLWRRIVPGESALVGPAATNVTTTTADLSVTFNGTGAVYDVTLYWGPTDGGTNPAGWADTVPFGTFADQATTNLIHSLSGLTSGDRYFYTWRASNCAHEVWTVEPRSFFTLIAPLVENDAGAIPGVGEAVLNGGLTRGEPAHVTVYWGENDGGTTVSAWDHAIEFGPTTNGAFATTVSNLLFGVSYYYRTFASNGLGLAWATNTVQFFGLDPNGGLGTVSNLAATGVSSTGAVLNAHLNGSGSVYTVWAYWDTGDGGTNPGSWANA
ncbi:MAG: hypothetical protein AAF492_18265, partial [Verrucomicrobiota bacterium]